MLSWSGWVLFRTQIYVPQSLWYIEPNLSLMLLLLGRIDYAWANNYSIHWDFIIQSYKMLGQSDHSISIHNICMNAIFWPELTSIVLQYVDLVSLNSVNSVNHGIVITMETEEHPNLHKKFNILKITMETSQLFVSLWKNEPDEFNKLKDQTTR